MYYAASSIENCFKNIIKFSGVSAHWLKSNTGSTFGSIFMHSYFSEKYSPFLFLFFNTSTQPSASSTGWKKRNPSSTSSGTRRWARSTSSSWARSSWRCSGACWQSAMGWRCASAPAAFYIRRRSPRPSRAWATMSRSATMPKSTSSWNLCPAAAGCSLRPTAAILLL